jgi:hypothetical protein
MRATCVCKRCSGAPSRLAGALSRSGSVGPPRVLRSRAAGCCWGARFDAKCLHFQENTVVSCPNRLTAPSSFAAEQNPAQLAPPRSCRKARSFGRDANRDQRSLGGTLFAEAGEWLVVLGRKRSRWLRPSRREFNIQIETVQSAAMQRQRPEIAGIHPDRARACHRDRWGL